jgi:glycosyltransferase involved in cell wall biosynthesis
MSISVAISCKLDQTNQREIVSLLAQDDRFSVAVITDSIQYPDISTLDTEDIYHCTTVFPDSIACIREFNPLKQQRYNKIIQDISPEILINLGASRLLFIGRRNSVPTVLVMQGGETDKATNNIYWTDSVWKQLRYRIFFSPLFKQILRSDVDEVWASAPSLDILRSIGLPEKKFVPFDWGSVNTDLFQNVEPVQYTDRQDITIIGSFRRIRGNDLIEDYAVFLDAIGELKKQRDDFHIVLGGIYTDGRSDPVLNVIDERINRHGLDEMVTKVQMVSKDQIPKYYSGLDIYFNFQHNGTSLPGLGTAAKEAMSAGAMYLSFDQPSPAYIINDGKNGMYTKRDARALAFRLEQLCQDEDLQKMLALKGKETVISRFSRDAIVNRIYSRCEALSS